MGDPAASRSWLRVMMIASGWLKSTPEKVAPTWNGAPPGTSPGLPPLQACGVDQSIR